MPKFTAPDMIAVTRPVSPSINRCELTHIDRAPIDVARARAQHAAYERALEAAGCMIVRLDEAADQPDSVFVEDTAVVCDEVALITRPGARARRPETPPVTELLRRYRPVREIDAPATVDGGDVLLAGRTVFIGRSERTNEAGVEQVRAILQPHGYTVRTVAVSGCLHLKSAVTALSDERLLLNPAWVAPDAFGPFDLTHVDSREPAAANVVRVGGELIYPQSFPRTQEELERLGFVIRSVDVSEIAKAEGAVTCCSLIFPIRPNQAKP